MCVKTKQDPVSTIQKTGWTIHSSFLVLSGLKKSFTLDMITRGQSTTIFLCIGPFSAWWRTNDNRVILEQACFWPVWEGSLLQFENHGSSASIDHELENCFVLIPYDYENGTKFNPEVSHQPSNFKPFSDSYHLHSFKQNKCLKRAWGRKYSQ